MVLEHAPPNRRGLCGSLVQVGFPIGLILASGVFALVSKLPEADFLSWGWRIPFLSSIVLVAVGSFIRMRVSESPVFLEMKAKKQVSSNPFADAIFNHPKNFFIAIGLKLCEVSWVYMLTVFMVVYATKKLGLSKALMLQAIMIAAAIEIVMIPLFGHLSDKFGRRPFYFADTIFTICFAFPLFWLLELRDPFIVIAATAVALSLGHGLMFGPEATYFPELFGARGRYTGASLGFQVSAAIGGGLSPILATLLVERFGGTAGVSVLLIGVALITMVAAFFAHETRDQSIAEL